MKTRLLGAAVLIALAVLFVPMFFSSKPPATGGDQTVSLAIPPAPDSDLQTKTMSLTPGVSPTPAGAPAPAAAASVRPAAGGDKLATVNIASNRPRDVETDPGASQKPAPTTVTQPAAAQPSAMQPLIPAQTKPAERAVRTERPGVTPVATTPPSTPASPPPAPALPAATAARGHFNLNLSAYASTTSAQNLMQRVQGLGYPVASRSINQAGKQLTLVTAGPFESRAAAEAARLKITQAIPGAPARLEAGATTPTQDAAPVAAAKAPAAARAGGWAVQVAAMGSQADANALRDKLRANGFDGYVDTVNANGKQLWRVRAGPQTQRDDAVRIREQIKTKLSIDGNVVAAP
ncbi:SPOR domain-containing protein [Dyella tabacisoli]|uniref:SPOR domain-containing protein n=1 Tax=Dyella tabacisoli TaxID=2282381 RepID=A0A369URG0_9GAMM|nr:SPOR domain-containing protein [Dyella tabacisoli]RDD83352.1 SPOR domain-containing protein [Dyella tabacisoli]